MTMMVLIPLKQKIFHSIMKIIKGGIFCHPYFYLIMFKTILKITQLKMMKGARKVWEKLI